MSSRDLFAVSRDLFVNIKDLFVIFDPTNGISINSHLLLPINSPHGEEVGDSWLFAYLLSCLFDLLVLSFYLISRLFGGKTPTNVVEKCHTVVERKSILAVETSELDFDF